MSQVNTTSKPNGWTFLNKNNGLVNDFLGNDRKSVFWKALSTEISGIHSKKCRKSHFLNCVKKKDILYMPSALSVDDANISSLKDSEHKYSGGKLFNEMVKIAVSIFYTKWDIDIYKSSDTAFGDITKCVWGILRQEVEPIIMLARAARKYQEKLIQKSEILQMIKENRDMRASRKAEKRLNIIEHEADLLQILPQEIEDIIYEFRVDELLRSLTELTELYSRGFLTEEEFTKAKNIIFITT